MSLFHSLSLQNQLTTFLGQVPTKKHVNIIICNPFATVPRHFYVVPSYHCQFEEFCHFLVVTTNIYPLLPLTGIKPVFTGILLTLTGCSAVYLLNYPKTLRAEVFPVIL